MVKNKWEMMEKDDMDWELVTDSTELSRLQTVESLVPKPLDNPKWQIGEREYKIIEDCLKLDWTIEQWCMLAGISVPSYYKHREKNPDFARRMDVAKQFPKMVARAAIQKRILQWDSKTALEYLKLRDKFYKPDVEVEEWETGSKRPVFNFITVPSKEWQNNTTNHDSQNDTKQKSAWTWYSNSWEVEKLTPRENEEQALKNIDSATFSNG